MGKIQNQDTWLALLQMVEGKFNQGSHDQWANKQYESLSEDISHTTKINLSTSSLKRIFGKVEYQYNPQEETKNALAIYVGFESWTHFVKAQAKPVESVEQKKNDRPSRLFLWAGIILVCLIGGIALINFGTTKQAVAFIEAINKFETAPATIDFKYDVSGYADTDISVNFNDETYGKVDPIKPHDTSFTHSYKYPDVYYPYLMSNGSYLCGTSVIAASKGWHALLIRYGRNENTYKVLPSSEPVVAHGSLHTSPKTISEYGFDTLSDYWVRYRYIKDIHLSGDTFSFEARARTKTINHGTDCPEITFNVMGINGEISFPVNYPGCTGQFSYFKISEHYITGNETNMTAFDHDLTDWRTIKVSVSGLTAKFYVDDVQFYTKAFQNPLGDIMGVMVQMKNDGQFDYIELKDGNHRTVWSDHFED